MSVQVPSTRRDRRFALCAGTSTVEFDGRVAVLQSVGACGFTCELEGAPKGLGVDSSIEDAVIRIGECVVRGDAVVRSLRIDGERIVFGCMFYPASTDVEERWMTLLAGVEAAQAQPAGDVVE